ncbi:MAG: hypothetical protein HRU11_02435 [Parvularculaceae bacterium]|nr:hypothetical protein [Parvularculaceae bacterium]
MPVYNVVISGSGIDLPSVDDPILGFATNRRVRAKDVHQASERAKMLIVREWQQGGYQDRNRASAPVLDIAAVEPLSLWKQLTTKPIKQGFTFHN